MSISKDDTLDKEVHKKKGEGLKRQNRHSCKFALVQMSRHYQFDSPLFDTEEIFDLCSKTKRKKT